VHHARVDRGAGVEPVQEQFDLADLFVVMHGLSLESTIVLEYTPN
jgi:hypothetical protein